MKKWKNNDSFACKYNHISAGINYLVPSLWWQAFCECNQQTVSLADVKYPELSFFQMIEVYQLINDHMITCIQIYSTDCITSIQHFVQQIIQQASKADKFAKKREIHEESRQVLQRLMQAQHLLNIREFRKLIVAPQIQTKYCELNSIQWNVVSASLWHAIIQKEDQNLQIKNLTVSLMVMLPHQKSYPSDFKYQLRELKQIEVYFLNNLSEYLGFTGFVEAHYQLGQFVEHLRAELRAFGSLSPEEALKEEKQQITRVYMVNELVMYDAPNNLYECYQIDQQDQKCQERLFSTIRHLKIKDVNAGQLIIEYSFLEKDWKRNNLEREEDGPSGAASKKLKKEWWQRTAQKECGEKKECGYKPSKKAELDNIIIVNNSLNQHNEEETPFHSQDFHPFLPCLDSDHTNPRITHPLWKHPNHQLSYAQVHKSIYHPLLIPHLNPKHTLSFQIDHHHIGIIEHQLNPITFLPDENQIDKNNDSNAYKMNEVSQMNEEKMDELMEELEEMAVQMLEKLNLRQQKRRKRKYEQKVEDEHSLSQAEPGYKEESEKNTYRVDLDEDDSSELEQA